MTTQEALDQLLIVSKNLAKQADQILEVNHYHIKFGNYAFTNAIRQVNNTIQTIECEPPSP